MGNEVLEKLRRRQFTTEFKVGAVKMVKDQGLDRAEVGRRLEVEPRLIKKWERAYEAGRFNLGEIKRVMSPEQQEISKLRAELSRARMENAILKNRGVLCQGECVRYAFVEKELSGYAVGRACEALGVSIAGHYACQERPEAAAHDRQASAPGADLAHLSGERQDLWLC